MATVGEGVNSLPADLAESQLRVRVVDSVDEVNPDDWERVAGQAGLYSSRRWLRCLEDDPTHDVWYLLAEDPCGDLRAVLPAYLAGNTQLAGADSFYDPGTVFFRDDVRAKAWRPTLLAGGRAGYETEILIDPALPPPSRASVLAALCRRLDVLGDAWDIPTKATMYLTEAAATELASPFGAAPLLTDVTAVLDLQGLGGIDDYLASLSGHRRGRVRRELREFAACGLRSTWTTLTDSADEIAPLLAMHHARYGHLDTPAMLAIHLRQQAEALGDLARVLLLRSGERLVGALLAYEWNGAWYARLTAADPELRGGGFAFFSLVFYLPLLAAIEAGASRYVLGPGGLRTKTNRGARPMARWSLLGGAPGVATDIWAAAWNARAAARWAAELGLDVADFFVGDRFVDGQTAPLDVGQ